MRYCLRCVYPENAKPAIHIDQDGICSGCRTFEAKTISRGKIDWSARENRLAALLTEYSKSQRAKGNPYDCIIPVSGGKDSHYQTYVIRERYKLNPLLVAYNHAFNTPLGLRNLTNLVEVFDCNLVRFSTAPGAARRLAKYMLERIGDVTWHYHAGIMTFPVQAAVQYDVPLVVWGEEGFSELVGMYNLDDMVEFTKRKRREHSMRGIEPEELLGEFQRWELAPFFYPSDSDIERVGVRGIYLSNYLQWDGRTQAELMIEQYGFETAQRPERTFNVYAKTDDIHANGLHDYLKYLKFGYGRATDDASNEIRHGRMTREQGIDMVTRYDDVRPSDMDIFLRAVDMTEPELLAAIEPMRDPQIWGKGSDGKWLRHDHIMYHADKQDRSIPVTGNNHPFLVTPARGPITQSSYLTL